MKIRMRCRLAYMVDEAYANWNHNVSRPEYVLNDFVQKNDRDDGFYVCG